MLKILIVDDDTTACNSLRLILNSFDYDIEIFHSGEEAVEFCKINTPDLILMELKLKGRINGLDAANLICKEKDIPVIFMTGVQQYDDIIDTIIRKSSYGYITKPININYLNVMIKMTFERHKVIKESKQTAQRLQLAMQTLELLNHSDDTKETIRDILFIIKNMTGFSSIAIRVFFDDKFTYFDSIGLDNDFVNASELVNVGAYKIDARCSDCWVTDILKQNINLNKPYFTVSGSFWTNNLPELIKENYGNRKVNVKCLQYGYQSVAVIPIKSKDKFVGVMHLNDKRPNMFTKDTILFFEKISLSIGITLERQKDLIAHFKKYQSLFEESPIAFIELDYSEIFEEISTSFIDMNIEKFIEKNIEKYVNMAKIVTCNTAALEIFECSTKDELGEKIFYLCCSYKKNLKHIILNFLNNNQYVAMETNILTANENMKHVKLRASVLTYEHKEYDRIFISLIDISERKTAEFELKKFKTALEENPFSLVITDEQGRIEYVNKKFTEITGYYFAEVKGKNPRILQSGKTEKNVYESLWKTILSGKVWKGVFINKRKNGELFWENATIAPVIDCDGIIKNFIALKEDITRQRKLEEMYVQSQKLEALGSLAGGIAHDFNNVLTVILSYTDYAKQILKDSDEMYLPISEIDIAAKKASEIVKQLLEFSKNDKETPKIVNVNEEIKSMKKMLSRVLGENITLMYNFTKQACFAFIDKGKFTQILINLLVNAKEAFDEKRKPHIIEIFTDIRTFENVKIHYERLLSGKYIEIKVKDNGPGIPEDILPKIFEPFYTTKSKGTGLGLSTISKIVNKAGGYIYVESELNIGTTFTILLPYVEFEADLIENENLEDSNLSGDESILIVEDDTSLRNIVCRVLRKLGYHMFEASTAAEAISIINRINIDLIIMDIVLPDKSGTELLEIIKKEKGDIKFVFISGYPENVLIEKFNLDFNDNFLSKPFNSNTLLKKIRSILDDK